MPTLQDLKAVGESIGLTGTDLQKFIKEQQDLERQDRQAEREYEKEQKDKDRERELKKIEKELEIAKQQTESAKQQNDKELELARIEQEQRDKDRAFELERLQTELELQKLKTEKGSSGDTKEEDEQETDEEEEQPKKDVTKTAIMIKGPKMPPFDEARDSMDSFLHRFEIYAAAQSWNPSQWAVFLSALLKGKALDVYSRLPVYEANDYDLLKDALLRRFNLTEEGFKIKFRSARAEQNEAPAQFITRLQSYFVKWIELAGTSKTFTGLCDMMVREQFIDTCPEDLAIFLKERAEMDLTKLAKLAEQYIDAHKDHNKYTSAQSDRRYTRPYKAAAMQSHSQNSSDMENDRQPRGTTKRKCFVCGKTNHLAKNCYHRAAAMQLRSSTRGRGYGNTGYRNPPPTMENMRSEETHFKELAGNTGNIRLKCKAHARENCQDCNDIQCEAHMCYGMLDTKAELKCGCVLPVIADACDTTFGRKLGDNMPVTQGKLGNRLVSVLRDTGCSTVVVRRDLVTKDQLTGEYRSCILIDGTIRKTPVADIDLDTPFFAGRVKAVCMKNPLYDVILGNVPGVTKMINDCSKKEIQNICGAVTTRLQAAKSKTPIKTPHSQDIDISKDELIELQKKDDDFKALWEKADNKTETVGKDQASTMYVVKRGLLYRKRLTPAKQETFQLLVPHNLREKVLSIAHDSILSGHQGIRRTYDRVLESFHWPGVQGDVARYCRSCDICQRTVAKGRVPNVPLGHIPVIDTPFQRVAVDLIGPIFPATERGHRYIVTLVDYATRYPEATPLKGVTAETVAEALVTIFSRVGVPREILSDQGTQFMSGIMKETSRLLSMKQLVTTPYHPSCNGLVERFNGTLKTMLKKMCAEKPSDWDRYIAPLLFAYREAPNESLGFSPFQLLYGRSVRGPMAILKELWTQEDPEPEVKLTYQYVLDLQDRLQETSALAREQLRKAKSRQARLFNKRTKDRRFKPGDKVLLLLPNNNNKLLLQWQGPFTVIEKTNSCDYKIQLPGRIRLFHANMLKQYFDREEPTAKQDTQLTGAAVLEPENKCEDECALELHNHEQTEDYTAVDINPDLTVNQQNQLRNITTEFSDIFTDVPRTTNLGRHEIKLTTDEPIRGKPYPLPFAMREAVDKEIDTMLKLGIIEPSNAPYASPIVVVKKPDGSNRICIDYRKLNKITIFDPEPMPQAEDIFSKLANSNWFSKFDLSKGYWQVPMSSDDMDATTFVTHSGLYRFRVMPFGLVNAPATFSRIMRKLLAGTSQLENYLDDVLAHTEAWDQHLETVRQFLTRVRLANLTLRPSKCSMGYTTINFLGHVVGAKTIKPNEATVQKIQEALKPATKKQLRSFLGLAGYYRRFVPDFGAVAVPLTDLTKKGAPNNLQWGPAQEKAFKALKSYIGNSPILRLPDFSKEFILQTDASNDGLGAVLLQEHSNIKHPVCFASRKLLPRESRYSTIERECLAIVWGIQKFEMYLYGRTFTLETDHQPLQYLGRAQFQNGRLMRWALALQPYSFRLRAIKGSDNMGADFLSRNF